MNLKGGLLLARLEADKTQAIIAVSQSVSQSVCQSALVISQLMSLPAPVLPTMAEARAYC